MRKTLIALSSLFALSAAAQSESGLWLGAEASYDITDRLGADLELGARLENGFSTFTRYDAALGFDYKAARWLKLGAGYDFIRDHSLGEEPSVVYKKGKGEFSTNDYGFLVDEEGKRVNPDGYRIDSNENPIVNGYNVESPYWRTKHRAYFDLTEKWKAGRFGFSLRERYQFTSYTPVEGVELKYRDELESKPGPGYTSPWAGAHADYLPAGVAPYVGPYADAYDDDYWYGLTDIKDKGSKTKHYLRTRLAVDYNIRRCPVTPFASYELANDLGDAFSIVRHRVSAGFDWNLTADKRHALSLAYIYQHGAQEEAGNADLHIISVGYKFSFESARAAAQKAAKKKAKKQNKK